MADPGKQTQLSEKNMPFEIKWTRDRVIIKYSGLSDDNDLMNMVQTIHGSPYFDDVHQELHDFTKCTKVQCSDATLLNIAARNIGASYTNPRKKLAVLGDRPDVCQMVGSFKSLGINPYPISVFETYEEADAWLKN